MKYHSKIFDIKMTYYVRLLLCRFVALVFILGFSFTSFSGSLVYVENKCKIPVEFHINDAISAQNSGNVIVAPSQRLQLKGFKRTEAKKLSVSMTTNREEIGSLFLTMNSHLTGYMQSTAQITGKITIDSKEKFWHSWYGTPSFTVTACPSVVDIEKSPMLKGVKRIVIFGDSVSDDGNLHEFALGFIPRATPYYSGMFSNGNVWSNQLKNDLNGQIHVSNYAVGGATAVSHVSLGYLPYTLEGILEMYRLNKMRGFDLDDGVKESPSSHMAIIFIGANDYIPASTRLSATQIDELTTKVVGEIESIVDRLKEDGVKKFVLVNLPDVGLCPICRFDQKNGHVASKLVFQHNKKLKALFERLKEAEQEGRSFMHASLFETFNDLIHNTSVVNKKYGLNITDTQESCWLGGFIHHDSDTLSNYHRSTRNRQVPNLPNSRDLLVAARTGHDPKLCDDPERYVFWDRIHPTYLVQGLIYDIIKEAIGIETKPMV